MGSLDAWSACSRLCAYNGGIGDKSTHGRRPVGTTCYRGIFTSLLIHSHIVLHLASGPPVYCHPMSITAFLFTQALQKIRLANHIHSIVELLHVDAIQQLEVALLGSMAAKLLDVLLMSMQHQAVSLQSTTVPPHPPAGSSIWPLSPSVPITNVMDTAGPADVRATLSQIPASKPSTETEVTPSKHQCIIPMPIFLHTFKIWQFDFPIACCCCS